MRYVGKGRRLARGALVAACGGGVCRVRTADGRVGRTGGWVPGAWAAEGNAYLDRAKTYLSKGNFSAAEIELRNAEREAPKDAGIRALLAQVYLRARQCRERGARGAEPPAT